MIELVEILQADYQTFPLDQTYSIYAADVYFQDPLNSFRGIEKYQNMINFISRWFQNIHLELHEIKQLENSSEHSSGNSSGNSPEDYISGDSPNNYPSKILTSWTLSWNTPLPWQPRIRIPGRSELEINAQGLISSHVDYWDCSIWEVLVQHFS